MRTFMQVVGKEVEVWLLYATSPYYGEVEISLVGPTVANTVVVEIINSFEEERGRDVSPRPIGRVSIPTAGGNLQLRISVGARNKYGLGLGVGVDALVFVPVVA